jgi:hypothetical protein
MSTENSSFSGMSLPCLKSPRRLKHEALPGTTPRDNPLALQRVRKASGPPADLVALLPCAPRPF